MKQLQKIDIQLNAKQKLALKYLFDDTTSTVLLSGSWRCGKSYVIAIFALLSILKYNNIRILVARNFFTDLRDTTIKTFQEVISLYDLHNRFEIRQNPFSITCTQTGSEILFRGVNDNDENSFKGLSLTHVLIDESSELPETIIKQLYGRLSYGVKENNIKSKVLLATNATKGWMFKEYYLPFKNNELPDYIKFISSNLYDNEMFLPKDYIKTMVPEIIGEDKYQLFVMNNWEYVTDNNDLITSQDIYNCFYNPPLKSGTKYLTCDPAGGGNNDNSVIVIWDEMNIIDIILFNNKDTNYLVKEIKEQISKHNINVDNVIVETSGLGLPIQQQIYGSTSYIPNATNLDGFNKDQFASLKDYCYYTIAKLFKGKEIHIGSEKYITQISEEFVAHKFVDKEGKIRISPKDEVKRRLGHSPDISDAISMRGIKLIKPSPSFEVDVWSF